PVVGHPADAGAGDLVGRTAGYVMAVEPDRAAVRPRQAEDRAQHRGLACAIGTEQREHLCTRHRQRSAEQRLRLAIERIDRVDFEDHASRPRLERLTHSFCCSSCGVPRATTWPQWITEMRSASENRNSMSCSMATMVSRP